MTVCTHGPTEHCTSYIKMEMEIELGIAGVEAQPVVHDGTPANMLKSNKFASLLTS